MVNFLTSCVIVLSVLKTKMKRLRNQHFNMIFTTRIDFLDDLTPAEGFLLSKIIIRSEQWGVNGAWTIPIFCKKFNVPPAHFARNTKALFRNDFLRKIDGLIFYNPYMLFRGRSQYHALRCHCWDENLANLEKNSFQLIEVDVTDEIISEGD